MTNREYLNTLNDEELAYVLAHIEEIASNYYYGYTDTVTGMTAWLKEEHHD